MPNTLTEKLASWILNPKHELIENGAYGPIKKLIEHFPEDRAAILEVITEEDFNVLKNNEEHPHWEFGGISSVRKGDNAHRYFEIEDGLGSMYELRPYQGSYQRCLKLINEERVKSGLMPLFFSSTEKALSSAKMGAFHGGMRVATNFLSDKLEQKGFSKLKSKLIGNLTYYGGIFTSRVYSHSARIEDLSSCLNVVYESILETGQICMINTALTSFNYLLFYAGKVAQKLHCNKAAKILNVSSACINYGIFAKDAVENGVIPTVSAVAAGASTQAAMEYVIACSKRK